jgi:hypothetical protein
MNLAFVSTERLDSPLTERFIRQLMNRFGCGFLWLGFCGSINSERYYGMRATEDTRANCEPSFF